MRIRWTTAAADDLEAIFQFLQINHPPLTRVTVRELYDAARSLKMFPSRGRPGREAGTRELTVQRLPFVIVYRVQKDSVEILRIWHTSQDRD